MKFKNTENGLVFDIVHEDTIKRLQRDDKYIQIDEKQPEADEPDQEQETEETEDNEVDYSDMKWGELRNLAKDKGLPIHGVKRKEMEQQLKELEG